MTSLTYLGFQGLHWVQGNQLLLVLQDLLGLQVLLGIQLDLDYRGIHLVLQHLADLVHRADLGCLEILLVQWHQ